MKVFLLQTHRMARDVAIEILFVRGDESSLCGLRKHGSTVDLFFVGAVYETT